MVLCYSRMMYVEFTVSQTMEHFLGCHLNAFEFFAACQRRRESRPIGGAKSYQRRGVVSVCGGV